MTVVWIDFGGVNQFVILSGALATVSAVFGIVSLRLSLIVWRRRVGTSGCEVFDLCRCFAFMGGWLCAVSLTTVLLQDGARFGPSLYWMGWVFGMLIYLHGRYAELRGRHPFQRS